MRLFKRQYHVVGKCINNDYPSEDTPYQHCNQSCACVKPWEQDCPVVAIFYEDEFQNLVWVQENMSISKNIENVFTILITNF